MKTLSDSWFCSYKGMGLGNFIQLTPSIREVSKILDKPIPVFFEKPFIAQCFLDCDFIRIIKNRPDTPPLNSEYWSYEDIGIPERNNVWNKTRYFYDLPLKSIGRPYIDIPPIHDHLVMYANRVVVMNGSGSQDKRYIKSKSPDVSHYSSELSMTNHNGDALFIGDTNDIKRNKALINELGLTAINLPIRDSLSILLSSSYIITNDTGLAHAAGVYDKPMTVLWKDTKLIKNSNAGRNSKYLLTATNIVVDSSELL